MMPNDGLADKLRVSTQGNSVDVGGMASFCQHDIGATDNFDSDLDATWSYIPSSGKYFKIVSTNSSGELYIDSRSLESEKSFGCSLSIIGSSTNITSTNALRFVFPSVLDVDPTRHYTAKIHCASNWTPSHVAFDKTVNVRDVAGTYIGLPGIESCLSGTVYGTVDISPAFNKLVSSSSGNGTNSPEGSEIVNYNSTNTVSLNANVGGFVDKFIVTTTDNIGNVAVATNDIVGQNVSSTNVVFPDLKGSNSIYAVYGTKQFPVNVATSGNGTVSPTNATVLYNGFMTVVFSAGTNSLLEAIVEDGITSMTFNPATNNYNYTSGAVTNDKTIRGIFDLKKFLVSTFIGANGNVSSTNAVVNYGASTNINVNAATDYKISGLNKNGVSVPAATGLESYVVGFSNVTNNQTLGVTFNEKLTTNGIPHTWLTQYGITNKTDSIESVDFDNDGFNTLGEYTADTNPTNSSSYYKIGDMGHNESGMFVEILNSSTNRQYGLKSRTSLSTGSWQNFTNGIIGNGNTLFINLGNRGSVEFFQGTVGLK